jgi:plastocyanin
VFSVASRTSFTLAVVAAVTGFLSVLVTHDRVGFTALMFAAAVAAAVGVAIFLFTPTEPLVPPSAEVEAATPRTVDVTDLPRPSVWPAVAAGAIALLALAAALGRPIVLLGLVGATVATFGWLAQVWREHPSWTPEMSKRINDRFVVPIALPATIVVFAGAAVISLSRLFLAVSADAAPVIGIVVAFAVLGVFTLVASREHVGRSALVALVVVSSILVVASGIVGVVQGEREFHHKGEEAGAEHGEGAEEPLPTGEDNQGRGTPSVIPGVDEPIEVVADNLEFDTTNLDLPAEVAVKLELDNRDSAIHNLSIYESKGGDELFMGPMVDPGDEDTYDVPPLAAGTYFFQCDVHPVTMTGTVEVAAPSTGASPGPPAVPSTTAPGGEH